MKAEPEMDGAQQPDLCISNIVSLKQEDSSDEADRTQCALCTNPSPASVPALEVDVLQHTLALYQQAELPHCTPAGLFTRFWRAAAHEYFRGEHVLVPFVPVHRLWPVGNAFETLGRILGHMWLRLGTVPLNIAQSTYLQVAEPSGDVCETVLLADMLLLVTLHERKLLEAALRDFPGLPGADLDLVQALFATNGFAGPLSAHGFRTQLLSLAVELLVNRPKQLVVQMRRGFPADGLASFVRTVERGQLAELLDRQRPSVQKVLDVLVVGTAPLLSEHRRTLYYLQTYIRSLARNDDQLGRFVFFASGSVHLPHLITVVFDARPEQRQRRIVANRCVRTVRFSGVFSTYQEFKRELNDCLSQCLP